MTPWARVGPLVALFALATSLAASPGPPVNAQAVHEPGEGYTGLPQPPDGPVPPKPKPPDPLLPASDDCQANVEERNGIVTLALRDPARVNQALSVTADGYDYDAHFDKNGGAHFRAPLFHDPAVIAWAGAHGQSCQRTLPFPDLRDMLATALIWTGPYDLDLQVTEPSGQKHSMASSSGAGTVALFGGSNMFEAFGEPGGKGVRAILYTMPSERRPLSGVLYFKVAFVSRGNPARPPFCGGADTAQVSYTIIHLSGGVTARRNGEFRSVPCGTAWNVDEDGFSPVWQLKF